jgi:hypothetical protein
MTNVAAVELASRTTILAVWYEIKMDMAESSVVARRWTRVSVVKVLGSTLPVRQQETRTLSTCDTDCTEETSHSRAVTAYSRQTMRWSLRSVNILSAVRGEYRACRWTEDFLLISAK